MLRVQIVVFTFIIPKQTEKYISFLKIPFKFFQQQTNNLINNIAMAIKSIIPLLLHRNSNVSVCCP